MEKPSEELIGKLARIRQLRVESDNMAEVDLATFEQQHKELQIEITMRRRQLKETREELDASRVKNQELSYSLDSAKRYVQEYERNMKLTVSRNKQLEQNLQEMLDAKSSALQNYEILKSENKLLRDAVTQCESEKYKLQRVNEELKSKNVCIDFYKTEIGAQQANFTALLNKINEAMKDADGQYKEISGIRKDIETTEKLLTSVDNIIQDKMSEIRMDNKVLEYELIKLKAKLAQLETSLKSDMGLQTKEEQYFFKEWKKCFIKLNLMEQLKKEKDANTKLILALAEKRTEEESLKTIPVQTNEEEAKLEEPPTIETVE